jgi:hypothetical protein
MTRLIALYPRTWRDRYELEFIALMAERPPDPRDRIDIVRGAIDARLHPQLRSIGPDGPEPSRRGRVSGIAAIAGGLVWIATSIGFYAAPLDAGLGYKDSGSVFWVALVAALLCGLAAVAVARNAVARSVPGRRFLTIAAMAVLLGAPLMVNPWPLLLLGLFAVIIGTLLFGLVAAAEVSPTGIVLAVAALLALAFNTENDNALLLIPLGMAWMLFGIVLWLRGLPVANDSIPRSTPLRPPNASD